MTEYMTEYKPIFCDACGEETSHVSRGGDDFECLVCKDKSEKPDKKDTHFGYGLSDQFNLKTGGLAVM